MKLLAISSLVILFFSYGSCIKGGKCEQAPTLNLSAIQVSFKEKITGKYLYAEVNPIYNIDSIKIYDENNQGLIILKQLKLIPNTSSRYWDVNFGNIFTPQTDAFDTDICRNFIVKYNYNETDTIKACFKAKKTSCGSVFEYLNVYYKNDLVGSITNETFINLIVSKP